MIKICGLQVKGLQSYQPSNFENDLTPGVLERFGSSVARLEGRLFLQASNFDGW